MYSSGRAGACSPPLAGRWGFPGGVLDLGETVAQGAMRELFEETGVTAEAAGPLTVIDTIDRDEEGRVRYHYTLVAVIGRWQSGKGGHLRAKVGERSRARERAVAGATGRQHPLLPDHRLRARRLQVQQVVVEVDAAEGEQREHGGDGRRRDDGLRVARQPLDERDADSLELDRPRHRAAWAPAVGAVDEENEGREQGHHRQPRE